MKKISIIILSISVFLTQSLRADDGPYAGVKASKLQITFKSIEGVDLANIYEEDYNMLDYHVGYNISNSFFELGYFDSSKESKNLGSITISGITFSANTNVDFDGWRLGYGYNYEVNDKFTITPVINYYDVDINASATITVASGSSTFSTSADLGGSDEMIDIGLVGKYKVSDNLNLGFGYLRTVDTIADTDKIEQFQISGSYKF